MVQVSQYRALLGLPDEIWVMADDLDWTENRLRPLTSLSHEEALRRACEFAREEGYTLTTVNVCGDVDDDDSIKTKPTLLDKVEKMMASFDRIEQKDYRQMTVPQKREFKNRVATLRRRLDDMAEWE
jgi:hypothetical protein